MCDEINLSVCRIKDCVKLSSESNEKKLFLSNEAELQSIKVLKKELPIHLTALLNANLVSDFKSALKVLRENNEFEYVPHNSFSKTNYRPQVKSYSNAKQIPNKPNIFVPYQFPGNNFNHFPHVTPQFNQFPYGFNTFGPYPHFYQPLLLNNTQPIQQQRENNSNQSRIKRYGAPVPMEQDSSNFHLTASEN